MKTDFLKPFNRKEFKKVVFILLLVISLSSCVSTKKQQMDFINTVEAVYYKNIINEGSSLNSRIDFHILFKESVPSKILLQKIHFRNRKSVVVIVNEMEYIAQFSQLESQQDLILYSDSKKEYGNVAPIIKDSNLELFSNEAILEYKIKNKTYFFKISNVQER